MTGWRVDIRSETEFAAEEADMAFEDEDASGRCAAILSNGKRCPNAALPGSRYCGLPAHQALEGKDTDQVEEAEPEAPAAAEEPQAPEPQPEAPERGAEEVIEPVASGEPEPAEEAPPAGEEAAAETPDPESSAAAAASAEGQPAEEQA